MEPRQLQAAMDLRPLTVSAWMFAAGRATLDDAVEQWRRHHAANARAVPAALVALRDPDGAAAGIMPGTTDAGAD